MLFYQEENIVIIIMKFCFFVVVKIHLWNVVLGVSVSSFFKIFFKQYIEWLYIPNHCQRNNTDLAKKKQKKNN